MGFVSHKRLEIRWLAEHLLASRIILFEYSVNRRQHWPTDPLAYKCTQNGFDVVKLAFFMNLVYHVCNERNARLGYTTCLYLCPSVCSHIIPRLPSGFSWTLVLWLFLIRSSFGWQTFYMKTCMRFCAQLAHYLLQWKILSTKTREKTETVVLVVCFPVILTGFKVINKRDFYSTSSSCENGLIVMTFCSYWRSLLDGPWCLRL